MLDSRLVVSRVLYRITLYVDPRSRKLLGNRLNQNLPAFCGRLAN